MWEGTLTKDESNVTWKPIDMEWSSINCRLIHIGDTIDMSHQIENILIRPICFKLQDNLYIAGGQAINDLSAFFLCCDKFNLKERNYHESVHFLPSHLPSVAHVDNNVVTDGDETFALIS